MGESVIKVAVTGLSVSQGYIPNYVRAPEARVVIVHDIDAERAREVAQRFNVPRWTTDYTDVLASDADMVDVSTPNHLHAEQALGAFEAGKHVLCQKPMARTASECRRMIDAARRAGRTLGVMMTMLNNPYAADLRRAIAEGYFGKIAAVRLRNAHQEPYRRKDKQHWRASRENVGGGSFIQLTIHQLNLALWLLGQDVVSVMAYSDNLYCRHSMEGDDVTAAVAQLAGGALMTMESGYSSTGHALEIYGTEGRVLMIEGRMLVEMARDFRGDVLTYTRPAPPAPPLVEVALGRRGGEPSGESGKVMDQNRRFVRALLAGQPAPTPGEIGLRDVAIVQAVYRSASEGRRVTVGEVLDGD